MKLRIITKEEEYFREEFDKPAREAFLRLAQDKHFRMIAGLDAPRFSGKVDRFIEKLAPKTIVDKGLEDKVKNNKKNS